MNLKRFSGLLKVLFESVLLLGRPGTRCLPLASNSIIFLTQPLASLLDSRHAPQSFLPLEGGESVASLSNEGLRNDISWSVRRLVKT